MFFDKKFAASLEAAAAGGGAGGGEEAGGGGLGGLGDLGGGDDKPAGGDDLGLGDLGGGGDKPADDKPADDKPAGDAGETTLLAEPPAKRDAPKRGNYKSHQRSYDKGGLTKRIKSEAGVSKDSTRTTPRTITPGYFGDHGMNPLANMSKSYTAAGPVGTMYEQKSVDNDLLEEQKLFTVNNEVEGLLKSLMEKKQHEDETQ